jgi:hypothetical protein
MSLDDRLAAEALRISIGWVRGQGHERALTAAIVFGGSLGQRYPDEAMRHLWALAHRAERIAAVARTAIGRLFAIDGEAETRSGSVPRYVLDEVRPLMRSNTDPRGRRTALRIAVALLAAREGTAETPTVARVIRTRSADVPVIAELFADAIRSAPHRASAVDALRDVCAALPQDSEGLASAHRLGQAIRAHLDSGLMAVLDRVLRDPRRAKDVSQSVIGAFLSAPPPKRLYRSRGITP